MSARGGKGGLALWGRLGGLRSGDEGQEGTAHAFRATVGPLHASVKRRIGRPREGRRRNVNY
eukprot:scaffold234638_cov33-Tisochrysis_lutea.AAC.1